VAQGGRRLDSVEVDLDGAKSQHGVYITAASGQGLRRGAETHFLNASIMTVKYQPLNPPWVLDCPAKI